MTGNLDLLTEITEEVNKEFLKKLRIGSVDYTIKEKSCVLLNNEAKYGTCDFSEQIIEIEKRASNQRKIQTLLHELLHAISYEYSLDLSEHQVELLSIGLLQVFRDNPSLKRKIF